MLMPTGGTQRRVRVRIHLQIHSGLCLRDVLEVARACLELRVHHETIKRSSTDKRSGNSDRWSCSQFEHVPANSEETQHRDRGCLQSSVLHGQPPTVNWVNVKRMDGAREHRSTE